MAIAFLISLAASLISLAFARYLTSPRWVDALFLTGAALGLATGLGAGLLGRWYLRRWQPTIALVLSLAAAVGRGALIAELARDPMAGQSLDFLRITLACSTVIWGLLALLWSTLAINDYLGSPIQGTKRRSGADMACLTASLAAVSLSLYSVAPVGALLGVKVGLKSFLGLFALALSAYGASAIFRRWEERGRASKRP